MTVDDVLVGYTGLVGSNLAAQRDFDIQVNSRDSDRLRGGSFGHVVFSAARAEKWRANASPDVDAAHVDELIGLLGSFSSERITLISTIDVYELPYGVDESSRIETAGLHAYGANRYRLERAVADLHRRALIVRLPALFGPGLKKNVVFDLLHENRVDLIHPDSEFQYYDLGRLGDDIDKLWSAGVDVANLVTEPVATRAVVEQAFHRSPLASGDGTKVVRYDVRTRYASVFDEGGAYIESQRSVLDRMERFIETQGVRK